MDRHRSRIGVWIASSALVLGSLACATTDPKRPPLAYDAEAFREAVRSRAPELSDRMLRAPSEVPAEAVERARARVMAAPPGPARVRALLNFLSDPAPRGLGLVYDWATSSTAERTIELGKGDCVALATVMVGIGRELRWPVYFAEARTMRPETHAFEEVTVLSDHMVVIVAAKTVQMVIDFLGRVEEGYDIRPIDDLTAYAHLINNVAGRLVTDLDSKDADEQWRQALAGFELATRIQPRLGRAWNNLGIAYARFGRFDEARAAYQRAVALDTAFGSAERNLIIMETRASGAPTLIESELR